MLRLAYFGVRMKLTAPGISTSNTPARPSRVLQPSHTMSVLQSGYTIATVREALATGLPRGDRGRLLVSIIHGCALRIPCVSRQFRVAVADPLDRLSSPEAEETTALDDKCAVLMTTSWLPVAPVALRTDDASVSSALFPSDTSPSVRELQDSRSL